MEVLNKKWERVYRWLLAYIDENKFSGNLKLPSENALCRDLKVSRDTVRAAMDQLERESLIRRSRAAARISTATWPCPGSWTAAGRR